MDLDMLNRLRVNAGKPELKSWKASKGELIKVIKKFQADGFTDALPGANVNATPVADDPKLLEPFKEPEKEEAEEAAPEKVTKVKAQLARGIETEGYAKHSRKAVQDIRRDERKASKEERAKVKLDEKDKKQIKDEAEDRQKPAKEKANKKILESKPKKDKAKKVEKDSDEITVAEIARDIGIDPRVARAKLRRHEDKIKKLHTKGQDRWTFPKSAKKEIKAILEGKAK